MLEPQNPSIEVSEQYEVRRWTKFETLKLSGKAKECCCQVRVSSIHRKACEYFAV